MVTAPFGNYLRRGGSKVAQEIASAKDEEEAKVAIVEATLL
jgi:hypothetical protein